jgi:Zn-dependent protease
VPAPATILSQKAIHMLRSWKLGKLFGIDVYVHWTFLALILFVALRRLDGGISAAVSMAGLLIAAFACVLLHEFGHALTARRFGIPTLDITLYPIGGVARLARLGEKPWEEFCIAVAGPAVNVGIAAILSGYLVLSQRQLNFGLENLQELSGARIALELLAINVWLILFNMLPAFPMDGGRVLRSLLSSQLGRLRATEIAARLGTLFAVAFGIYGLLPLPGSTPMLLLIGGFTFLAGRQELAMVRWIEKNRRLEPVDVLPVDGDILDVAPAHIDPGFSGVIWDERTGAWTLWRNGRPIHAQRHNP